MKFNDELTLDELMQAYKACIKRKRNTQDYKIFRLNALEELLKLKNEINTGTYKPYPSKVFVITKPKIREVWAGNFRDRIVHHLFDMKYGELIRKRCISDNFACIKGRGNINCVKRAYDMFRKCSQNFSKRIYILQLDIENFFMSIDKHILWKICQKELNLEGSYMYNVVKALIFDNCTEHCIKIGKGFDLVPYKKSLFNTDKDHGLPIGNLSSQIFASQILLNKLDQYVKHILKVKYYVRYVDDALIFSDNKYLLKTLRIKVNNFLESMNLKLNMKKSVCRSDRSGVKFLGFKVLPFRFYVLNQTVYNYLHLLLSKINEHQHASYKGLINWTASINMKIY